ncbi:MAG: acyl-CoA thioesterase [Planctomycetota bacterium]|nr:acyl-CoA thioesterase [Planctomycetota bacterium]
MSHAHAPAGGYHETPVEVRYVDTDQMGYAHHSCYVVWLEIGRIDWLRAAGFPYGKLEEQGILMPVVKLDLRYHTPGRFEDQLIVQTRMAECSRASVAFENRVLRQESEAGKRTLLAEGRVELACVGRNGRVQRLPDDLRARFESVRA